MKLEPKILYELHGFGQGLQKILLAAAIALALQALWLAIVEAVRRPRAALAWLRGAVLVAAIVATVLVSVAASQILRSAPMVVVY
ncbi:hypothetical protein [Bradyrhizobium cosmicum]|uniref:Probable N-methylhydantoinase B n=1 Tax=Bradyrhizobium cosmicum TaxID=1404864 RepID=A0AAI8MER1_9BRAD|nr:hypothetical protein [Bradyrhizobium cosmicum]BAL77016.1 probable N-methylhydantoinase B [Bradyrhizobium cosmicum]